MLAFQQPAMIHPHHHHHNHSRPESPSGSTPTIKTGMAANFGSSLFLFRGLHTISPYLLSEAALQPAGRSVSPTSRRPSSEDSGAMSTSAKSRRSWFGGSSPKTPESPCESFLLELRCSTCARRNARTGRHESCTTESDYNFGGGRFAFLERGWSGSGNGSGAQGKTRFKYKSNLEERVLLLDLCDFANYGCVARTKEALKVHMGDPYMAAENGNALPPVNVALLLEALRREDVAVREPIRKAEGWSR